MYKLLEPTQTSTRTSQTLITLILIFSLSRRKQVTKRGPSQHYLDSIFSPQSLTSINNQLDHHGDAGGKSCRRRVGG